MNKIFKLKARNPDNLRQLSEFSWPMVKSGCYGTESILYLGPKIWDILPVTLKTWSISKRRLKHGNLKIAHVGIKFTLKA